MGKTGSGRSEIKQKDRMCPKCGKRLEMRRRLKAAKGQSGGMWWVCMSLRQLDPKMEHYVPNCGYEERV